MDMRASTICSAILVLVALPVGGCDTHRRNHSAIRSYYRYDFTAAREALRHDAARNDKDVLLNNVRLGLAAMADGDPVEAEQALGTAFELLSTAGLNEDRTSAAILLHEGVKIWKGEPFEQALAYYWVAALYATLGDWENTRAASANALFRLTDFGADQNARRLTRRAAADPDYLENGYTAVDTDFALGFLMQAIASDLSGGPGSEDQLEAALEIDRRLEPVVEAIRRGTYDTLLMVDYGKGPTKFAYGPDDALASFAPQERHWGPLVVSMGGHEIARVGPACDVNAMAVDHRWNNLENARVAKSRIGDVLLTGGALAVAGRGRSSKSEIVALSGLAMMLTGALAKAGAQADTRYMEFAPQSIYLVPLELQQVCTLQLLVDGDPGSTLVLPDFVPGEPGAPRALYLRLHGLDGPDPDWLTATRAVYGNDATGTYTPQAYSMGYKRLMYTTDLPYQPRSNLGLSLSPRLGLQYEEVPP